MNLFAKRSAQGRSSNLAGNGSAVLIVMVLLGIMVVMVIANTTTLHLLSQELSRIDRQQHKKYGQDSHH